MIFLVINTIFFRRKRITVATREKHVSLLIMPILFGLLFWFHYSMKDLVEDAAETPHVWGLVILLLNQWDFWRTILSGTYMTSKGSFLRALAVPPVYKLFWDFLFHLELIKVIHKFWIIIANGISNPTRVSRTFTVMALRQCTRNTEITNLNLAILIK